MLARLLRLHPKTHSRLVRLSKEAERDGAYRVAKRLQAVVLNSEGRRSGELAGILKAPRSRVSEWLSLYQRYGVEGLLEGYRSGRPPLLTAEQRAHLGDILDSSPVAYGLDTGLWTSPMLAWVIEEEFGVAYLPSGARAEAAARPGLLPCSGRGACWRGPMRRSRTGGTGGSTPTLKKGPKRDTGR